MNLLKYDMYITIKIEVETFLQAWYEITNVPNININCIIKIMKFKTMEFNQFMW
jgi:hypothetical protein